MVLADESAWTLQKVDLVDYNSLSEEYKKEISKEAVLIYDYVGLLEGLLAKLKSV